MSAFIRLYPKGWRERYGEEMADLLETRPPTMRDRLDLVNGAIDAHLNPTWQAGRRPLVARVLSPDDAVMVRRLGWAAILGGFAWAIVPVLALTGPVLVDESGTYRDGSAAIPWAFLAGCLLVAGLFGQLVQLPEEARWARRAAASAIPFVLLYMAAPWLFPIGALTLALLVAAAVGARRANAWTTPAAAAVLLPSVATVGVAVFAIVTYRGDRVASGTLIYVGMALLIPIWLAVGGTLLQDRRDGSTPGIP